MKRTSDDTDDDAQALALAIRAKLQRRPAGAAGSGGSTNAVGVSAGSAPSATAVSFRRPGSLMAPARPSSLAPPAHYDKSNCSAPADVTISSQTAPSAAAVPFRRPGSLLAPARPAPLAPPSRYDSNAAAVSSACVDRGQALGSRAAALGGSSADLDHDKAHAAAIFGIPKPLVPSGPRKATSEHIADEGAANMAEEVVSDAVTTALLDNMGMSLSPAEPSEAPPFWVTLQAGDEVQARIDGSWVRVRVEATTHAGYENAIFRVRRLHPGGEPYSEPPREVGTGQVRAVAHTEAARMARGPCLFFARGECTRGDKCRFSHSSASQ